jgi:hypothetical protein
MQTHPHPTQGALEKIAWVIRHLIQSVVTITCCNRIDRGLASRTIERLQAFLWRMERLTARLAAGTYKPRPKTGPRKNPIQRTPQKPTEARKKRNWLSALLLEPHRGSLDRLLREPAMVALIETAPAETVRPLRSLCFMLGLPAPDILKLPRKPRQPKARPETPAPAAMTGSEILMSASAPEHLRAQWAKPKGSISNRLYRKRRPPRAKNSA